MTSVKRRNSNQKRLGLFERLTTRFLSRESEARSETTKEALKMRGSPLLTAVSGLNQSSRIVKRVKMRLGERYASDPAKFLQLLGMKILRSRNIWIERMDVTTVEDSEKGVIEWMYGEATVCTMDRGGDDGLCTEFRAEAEFLDGHAYVKFSKLGFHSVLDLVRDSHSSQS